MEPLSHPGLPRLSWIDTLYSSTCAGGGRRGAAGTAGQVPSGPGGRGAAWDPHDRPQMGPRSGLRAGGGAGGGAGRAVPPRSHLLCNGPLPSPRGEGRAICSFCPCRSRKAILAKSLGPEVATSGTSRDGGVLGVGVGVGGEGACVCRYAWGPFGEGAANPRLRSLSCRPHHHPTSTRHPPKKKKQTSFPPPPCSHICRDLVIAAAPRLGCEPDHSYIWGLSAHLHLPLHLAEAAKALHTFPPLHGDTLPGAHRAVGEACCPLKKTGDGLRPPPPPTSGGPSHSLLLLS